MGNKQAAGIDRERQDRLENEKREREERERQDRLEREKREREERERHEKLDREQRDREERERQNRFYKQRYDTALKERDDALEEEKKLKLYQQRLINKRDKVSLAMTVPGINEDGKTVGTFSMDYTGPGDGVRGVRQIWEIAKHEGLPKLGDVSGSRNPLPSSN